VGKSTELLRLQEYLEGRGYFLVSFAADQDDIEIEGAEYADILVACTRHLVQSIPIGNHNPLVQWLQERWDSMKELALSEVQFDGLTIALVYSRFRALLDKRMN
jgi:hypothetical protein